MESLERSLAKKFPVMEVFGPTLQGEGAQCGLKTHFIRFGYCDSRCSWCDSPHAVLPELVKKNAVRMNVDEISAAISKLGPAQWVTLSGGNPAMHDLGYLVVRLQEDGHKVNIETQGTLAPLWIKLLDAVTISPKPPSSGMAPSWGAVADLLSMGRGKVCLKVPVFDDEDFQWVVDLHKRYPGVPLYLSVGTERDLAVNGSVQQLRSEILERYEWLADKALREVAFTRVFVLPQLHVLLWGSRLGV